MNKDNNYLNLALVVVLVIFGFCLGFLFFALNDVSNAIEENNKKIANIEVTIKKIEDKEFEGNKDSIDKEVIELTRKQFEDYREFAKTERESFTNLISLFFKILGAIGAILSFIFIWIVGQTKKEVRADISASLEKLVDNEVAGYEEKLAELRKMIDNQIALRNSKVLLICPKKLQDSMRNLEVKKIKERVSEVKILDTEDIDAISSYIRNSKVDLIIYKYQKTEQQEANVRQVLSLLKEGNYDIPFIVYTSDKVEGEVDKEIRSYNWSIYVNLPTTLISTLFSLAYTNNRN
ncbi:hypothetical protein [Parageobacillus thermoglucosidasius]|uniref:hypothetical protein n=1 Tax=Parageobacillus thermoglucosidasius TaxID=1426 RepID=UPI000B5560C7|nr:hypothetical protein [Parageobacillus thermoglucosidasius]MBY6269556.1 hypothetical protein [Parageobacillus thermoglucosidasius]OUM88675.1 MAG: hypothetical protein BAA00_00045 [Parageobacillus thermoglucosidasius]